MDMLVDVLRQCLSDVGLDNNEPQELLDCTKKVCAAMADYVRNTCQAQHKEVFLRTEKLIDEMLTTLKG